MVSIPRNCNLLVATFCTDAVIKERSSSHLIFDASFYKLLQCFCVRYESIMTDVYDKHYIVYAQNQPHLRHPLQPLLTSKDKDDALYA